MADNVSDIFEALAHPTRRQILQDLKDGELAAGEIASRFAASGPTISRHLGILRGAGLVEERRDANRILYSLVGDRLALSVGDFLSTVCPEQIVLREVRKRSTKVKSQPNSKAKSQPNSKAKSRLNSKEKSQPKASAAARATA